MVFFHASGIFILHYFNSFSDTIHRIHLEEQKVFMTDLEYDILDELYFVISFSELQQKMSLEENLLKEALQMLLGQGYIKCFSNVSDELPPEHVDFENNYRNYHYLASKEGLFAHNST